MSKKRKAGFGFKRDGYARSRGGTSVWLVISCGSCDTPLLLYQKDGPGRLLRLYLDRIFVPADLPHADLACPHCQTVMAVSFVYLPEDRPALRLIPGRWQKRVTNQGVFPSLPEGTKGSADNGSIEEN